jgi:plasmid stabilization system protein ParE
MKYEVVWGPRAEGMLADVWMASDDRAGVAAAAAWLDAWLARSPLTLGESRDSSVHRVAIRELLGIEFEVVEDDKRVIVQGVFGLG